MKNVFKFQVLLFLMPMMIVFLTAARCDRYSDSIRIGVFEVDASPPIGSPVAYAKAVSIEDPLKAKGIVILSDEKPVVLCVVDWLGIANEGQDAWRASLAKAAGTTVDRVSVHVVHQHDGLRCDFTVEKILKEYGLGGWRYDNVFLEKTIQSVANAVKVAAQTAQPVTHLGIGQAKVEKVASNRRILGEDGKVKTVRFSSTRDSAAIAAPEGLVDPWLKSISFWKDAKPIVVLNYYASHPMSHYGKGHVSSDFVGIAREKRQADIGIPHIYFTGASGDVAAGKYNDGSPERRPILAGRMENAMKEAWDQIERIPITKVDFAWNNTEVQLPLGKHLVENDLVAQLKDVELDSITKFTAAKHLAWLRRTEAGNKVNISAAKFGHVQLLNIPGESSIEYQVAAQKMKPEDMVCTAAYEEYGPGYICLEIAYSQGGYESSNRASRVAPEVEPVLMNAMRQVLGAAGSK
jgi:hypothetical protein